MFSVRFGPLKNIETGESVPPSWYAYLPSHGKNVVAHGFARRIDAEIAARVLPKYGVDWTLPFDELDAQLQSKGGEEALQRFVCEHLQW